MRLRTNHGPRALAGIGLLVLASCGPRDQPAVGAIADRTISPTRDDTLRATVVTQPVREDSDDPAIWVDRVDPAHSLIIGTDKGDSTGGLYVFRLDGTIDTSRTRRPLRRPNNVDVLQGVVLGRDTLDIAAATERGAMALRIFRLPDMTPIDGGGLPLFDGDVNRAPMGVALYRRARDGAVFAIVGGKSGPPEGYLWQYRIEPGPNGTVRARKVRAFGRYSGRKEIEAIAIDQSLGFVYYSDETVGIRQYHADPDAPDAHRELALFGTTGFVSDHEGIAVYPTGDATGYLLISDQQGQRLRVYTRQGPPEQPYRHDLVAVIPVSARETDGLEVTVAPLGARFPEGLLAMMSTDRTFHLYDWRDVRRRIEQKDTVVTK